MSKRSVTAEQRRRAAVQANDVNRATAIGVGAMTRLFVRFLADVKKRLRADMAPAQGVGVLEHALAQIIASGMAYSRMQGIRRGQQTAPIRIQFQSEPYARASAYLRRLLDISRGELTSIQKEFDTKALEVAKDLTRNVERKIRAAVAQTLQEGQHVREASATIYKAFEAAGVTPTNSFQIENIFRTQTLLAYGAGKQDFENSPVIQEILWGYKYVTVGDDRVRPEHAALDGTVAPKDDPIWERIYPPNGFSCRCQVIPLFEPEEVSKPSRRVKVDGEWITPGPDEGFGFAPASLFKSLSDLAA